MMRKYSFTLLEMVAVLIIITVISLLALQSFRTDDNLASAHGNALLTYLSTAHNRAMSEGKTVEVFWQQEFHVWHGGGKKDLPAPDKVTVKTDGVEPGQAVFRFFADGSAQAARVRLEDEKSVAEVCCFPLSGTAKMIIPENPESEKPEIKPLWVKESGL